MNSANLDEFDNYWTTEVESQQSPTSRVTSMTQADPQTEPQLEEYFFNSQLERYFSASVLEQKAMRPTLAAGICSSEQDQFEQHLKTVLCHVAELPSQNNLTAAIDLLAMVGKRVSHFALRVQRLRLHSDENALFVLGNAAARQEGFVSVLLQSRLEAMREGVIEALGRDSSLSAKVILLRVASSDPSAALRERAQQLADESA